MELITTLDWQYKGYLSNPYPSFRLKDGKEIPLQSEYNALTNLFNGELHGANLNIVKAFAICNSNLERNFEEFHDSIERGMQKAFSKEDWTQDVDRLKWRTSVRDCLQQ